MSTTHHTGPEHRQNLRGEAVEIATKHERHEKALAQLAAGVIFALVYVGDELGEVVKQLHTMERR